MGRFEPFVPQSGKGGHSLVPKVNINKTGTAGLNKAAVLALGATPGEEFRVSLWLDIDQHSSRVGIACDAKGAARVDKSGRCSGIAQAILMAGGSKGSSYVLEHVDLPPVTHQIVVRQPR